MFPEIRPGAGFKTGDFIKKGWEVCRKTTLILELHAGHTYFGVFRSLYVYAVWSTAGRVRFFLVHVFSKNEELMLRFSVTK